MNKLTDEQECAYSLINAGHNCVITGQAGTGKSFLIRECVRRLRMNKKNVSVTASTGIAAFQFNELGGTTLHHWSGIGDGRHEDRKIADMIIAQNGEILSRIRRCDVLIIDEISMVSCKVFEKVESVCRKLRGGSFFFGGLQIVCGGDFCQLPPVPNDLYKDPGERVFLSDVWKTSVPHKLVLTHVHRQADEGLIKIIHELERGAPSAETNATLRSLAIKKEFDTKESVFLFATNLEVDIYNIRRLNELPGEEMLFRAEDSGLKKKLHHVKAKETLRLKNGCPVMLLRNLTPGLVNGMIGHVLKLEADGPIIKFPTTVVKIKPVDFSVYDTYSSNILATRNQLPLNLAFGLTIHKSQGLTLKQVQVDCTNIRQPGQLAVAVGRAVSLEGLRVVNYTPNCCKSISPSITEFEEAQSSGIMEDFTCCKEKEKMDHDDARIIDHSSDIIPNRSIYDNMEETLDNGPGFFPCDDPMYDEEATSNIIEDILSRGSVSEEQKCLKKVTEGCSLEKVQHFLNVQYSRLHPFLTIQSKRGKEESYNWPKFYADFHNYTNSRDYHQSCMNLFPSQQINHLFCGNLLQAVRKTIISSSKSSENLIDNKTSSASDISPSAYGKIRYVGGRSVAKVKYRHSQLVRNCLNSAGVVLEDSKLKVALLQALTQSQSDVIDYSKYQTSILDTLRKQNLNNGLTNINDDTFEFFLMLEKMRIPLYTEDAVRRYQKQLLQKVHKIISEDSKLVDKWSSLFRCCCSADLSHSLSTSEHSPIIDSVNSLLNLVDISSSLFEEVILSYLRVTDAEFRRKFLSSKGKMKTMEHRKKVLIKKTPSVCDIRIEDVIADNTNHKLSSHFKLKGAVLKDRKSLNSLTKRGLLKVGRAYGTKLSSSLKKDDLCRAVSQAIVNSEEMTDPTVFVTEKEPARPVVGKGKRKANRANYTQNFCPGCDRPYRSCGGNNHTWIRCNSCDRWWHRSCSGIEEEQTWIELCNTDAPWSCLRCSIQMDQ